MTCIAKFPRDFDILAKLPYKNGWISLSHYISRDQEFGLPLRLHYGPFLPNLCDRQRYIQERFVKVYND